MAEYDGSVRIKTEIDSKGVSSQLSSLENRITKTADKVASLRSKMDSLKDAKIPTEAYEEVQNQITETERKLTALYERQEKFLEIGGKTKSSTFKNMQYDISQLENTLSFAKGELQDLVGTGKAFTLGSGTQEYADLGQKLNYAESELSVLNQKHDELISKQNKVKKGYDKLGTTAKKSIETINKSTKKTNGLLGTMASRFKGLALSLLIFNQISKAFSAMIQGIKDGFENLYNENEKFKSSVDGLKASTTSLKNSFATAFSPIVEIAIPYIKKLTDSIYEVFNAISQFTATITGKDTYTKAIKLNENYIDSLNNSADAAKKAASALFAFDELNVVSKETDSGEAESATAGTMFEEVPIDQNVFKISDTLKEILGYAEKLKEIFSQGFFDGLGDVGTRFDTIKESLTAIKENIVDVFSGSEISGAISGFAESVIGTFGTVAGSVASIGLTIATNLVGGISQYIDENKDRVKNYLISMFDIWSSVSTLYSDLFAALANIFTAFTSENGIQFTSNLIGIFSDAFMGITELASKVFHDIINIIIQPFVDNQEAFKVALEGFLGILAEVTGTIKQGIDDTFAKLNEVYDEHFKPFFESIATGLSDTVGIFLDFWNESVQPVLEEWADGFDTLWKEHIQPMLNSFIELLGDVADFLKVLWENYLKPLIDWIIKNVLPVVLPIIKGVGKAFLSFYGMVSDIVCGIIDIIDGIIVFLTDVFSGNWKDAWDGIIKIFKGVSKVIKGIVNGILGIIEALANGVIDGLNIAINALNNLSFEVPDWIPGIGGKTFGFNIPTLENFEIPKLATGAVLPANKPFMAVVGDQKHGTNVEAPLDTIKQAVRDVLQDYDFGNQGGDVYISAEGDLDALVRLLKFRIDKENKRIGKNFEKVVTV